MGVFRAAALAAMTSLACLPAAAEASACWHPDEARAAQVRGLQTMLMVGTLQCRHRDRRSEHLYTDFILNQRIVLDQNSAILKARFVRENGWRDAQSAYDRFGTSLANRYSAQLDNPAFCATVHRFASLAARAGRQQLMELADAVAVPPMVGQCSPAPYVARSDRFAEPYREPPPPPRLTVSEAAEVQAAPEAPPPVLAPEPAPVEATAQPAVQVQAEVELAPAPAPVKAMVQPASLQAEPAATSREAKLEAAIAALQSAVTALQAAKAPEPAPEPAGGAEIDAQAADPGTVMLVEVPANGSGK